MIGTEEVLKRVQGHSLIRDVDTVPKGHIRIDTGFIYPDGTSLEVFLVEDGALLGNYKVSDLGQTMSWLLAVQVKPWLSKKRQSFLEDSLRLYDVHQNGGALESKLASLDELPVKIIRLAQACLRVSDLLFTRRSSLQTTFMEQVEEVIVDLERPYEANVELVGRFPKPIRVDFVVQGENTRAAMLALSSGSSSQAHVTANEIFRKWYDLDVPSRNEQRVTIFDDSRDVYRDEDLLRIKELSSLVALSDRQAISDLLAA